MTIIRTLPASGYPGAFLASLAAFTARDRTTALIYGKLKAFMLSVRDPRPTNRVAPIEAAAISPQTAILNPSILFAVRCVEHNPLLDL